jgi:hypothetical protein
MTWSASTHSWLALRSSRARAAGWRTTPGAQRGRRAGSISFANRVSREPCGPGVSRVVRVGTHAVSANSKSTLWGRLRTHRGARKGGGNHRSSIFRLHVGAAMLARDGADLPTWGIGSSALKPIHVGEASHERHVSAYIGAMSVLWVEVPDEPSPESARAFVERNAIALLSNEFSPVDPPSGDWLGLNSPCKEIRRSGLWNLDHVERRYEPGFLDVIESCVVGGGSR